LYAEKDEQHAGAEAVTGEIKNIKHLELLFADSLLLVSKLKNRTSAQIHSLDGQQH